jgi:hypothetical protein
MFIYLHPISSGNKMNYLLLLLTALLAFAYGMLFAFWLIFARTASRLASLLTRVTGKDVTLEEVYQTLKNIIDKAYEEMRREENENSKNNK